MILSPYFSTVKMLLAFGIMNCMEQEISDHSHIYGTRYQ